MKYACHALESARIVLILPHALCKQHNHTQSGRGAEDTVKLALLYEKQVDPASVALALRDGMRPSSQRCGCAECSNGKAPTLLFNLEACRR